MSPPTTRGSEVPLLITWSHVELPSACRTRAASPWSAPQAVWQSSRAVCWHTAAFQRDTVSQGSVVPCVHVKVNTGRQLYRKNNLPLHHSPLSPLLWVIKLPALLWKPSRALLISASFLSAFSYPCGAWQFSLFMQLFKNDPNMQGALTKKKQQKKMFCPRKKWVPSPGWRKNCKILIIREWHVQKDMISTRVQGTSTFLMQLPCSWQH